MRDVLSEHDRYALTVMTKPDGLSETKGVVRSGIRGPPPPDTSLDMR